MKESGGAVSSGAARIKKQSFLYGFGHAVEIKLSKIKYADHLLKNLQQYAGETPKTEPGALVKAEKIVISEKKRKIEREAEKCRKTEGSKIEKIDEDAFFEGMIAGDNSPLTNDIALPAKRTIEEVERLQNILRERKRKAEEREHHHYPGFSARIYYAGTNLSTAPTAVPVQMKFDFGVFEEE